MDTFQIYEEKCKFFTEKFKTLSFSYENSKSSKFSDSYKIFSKFKAYSILEILIDVYSIMTRRKKKRECSSETLNRRHMTDIVNLARFEYLGSTTNVTFQIS